jgi:thiamine biosynthesis lipoprotein
MMPRSPTIALSILGAWFCAVGPGATRAEDDFAFFHENVMGTSLELRVQATSAAAARCAEARVLAEVERLSSIFSGYDPKSEFRRWQAGPKGPTKVSAELFALLGTCDRWREFSGGAFDPRVQALTRLWSRCAEEGRTPASQELAETQALMSRAAWRLDPKTRAAERMSDCPLSLNAIAKGYIVERACEAALTPSRGVRGLLLNVGGDLRVCGAPARTIAIVNPWADSESSEPLTTITVGNRAVATSGNSQRGFQIGEKWYSHIFDPRTGWPVEHVASATVIAPRSADADALATIFNVLAPEESLQLVRSLPEVECLIVTTDGRIVRSPGWERFERTRPWPLAVAFAQGPSGSGVKTDESPKGKAGASWSKDYELVVNFEINRPDTSDGPYRRPYVVVWIENQEGKQVRTLLLWVSYGGAGPYQWLPDLKRWYRSEQDRFRADKTDVIGTVSRPTRPPGKYKVIWDGKDNKGNPVAPGTYTVHVEAAREHGTYQSIRKQVTISDKPFAEDLKGNVEIKAASIEYRRKAQAK